MSDLYAGLAAVAGDPLAYGPGPALTPGATLVPRASPFAAFRAPLWSMPLSVTAPAGAQAVTVRQGLAPWDYRVGVHPGVEGLAWLPAGASVVIGGLPFVLGAPLWRAPAGADLGAVLATPLVFDLPSGSALALPGQGAASAAVAYRVLKPGDLTAARLNATMLVLATAINRVAGALLLTWEGAESPLSNVNSAAPVTATAAFVRGRDGDYVDVVTAARMATDSRRGLVRQAAAVANATWPEGDADWDSVEAALGALVTAARGAGWVV